MADMREWFYASGNRQQGPVQEAELIAMLAAGRLKADTLVWTAGLSDWVPAGEVEALADASRTHPPLPATGAAQSTPDSSVPIGRRSYGHHSISGFGWYLDGLKNYGVFQGRSRRSAYWMFLLFDTVFTVVASFVDTLVFSTAIEDHGPIVIVYTLATIVPYLAVGVRRMHDTGRSGWWVLVPIVNFVFYCQDSQSGDNMYGPNPKA